MSSAMDANLDAEKAEDANDSLKDLPSKDDSPNLHKRFGNLSINVHQPTSPEKQTTTSYPRATPKSPRSPSLQRKSSNPALPKQIRRTSSSLALSPKTSNSTAPIPEERPPVTAASVAADFFRKELVYHIGSDLHEADTLVIAHDYCYGHRFSRPKTSKTNLSYIFERPERLQAGALGMASAYVRLGQRHAGAANPPHPRREPSPRIPFRIQKTTRTLSITSPYVTAVHGLKWMQDLKTMCEAAGMRLAAGDKELKRPDTPTQTPKPCLHEGDLYLCKDSLDAFEGALGGVCEGVDAVFNDSGNYQSHKKAFVCIRPPGHHCSADLPSGFCWINNVHVGIEYAAQTYGLTHAAIIDFDLHHGDGSQAIAWERNAKSAKLQAQKTTAKNAANKKTFIGYFSLHDINSYPCEEGDIDKVQRASVCIDNAHGQTIWNVHLESYADEAEFWKIYESRYCVILEKTRMFLRAHTQRLKATPGAPPPKAAIFISAGFDASQWETPSMQRHKVSVPTEFYARFTVDIVKLAQEEGCSTDGRVISVLEGGYSDRAISSGVLSHISGLSNPQNIGPPPQPRFTPEPLTEPQQPKPQWDPRWWSDASLTELDNLINPPPPPPPSKRPPRSSEPHSYQSPTQSFTAKAVDPEKVYRTFSASRTNVPTPPRSRPPTPPPPDVDWATATHELSKLLIPSERQIDSCKHEELNEPRQKRERHSSIGIASTQERPAVGERMTRGRKAKGSAAEPLPELEDAHRRQTLPIGGADGVSESNVLTMPPPAPTTASSRASSKARQPGPLQVNKTRRVSASGDKLASAAMAAPPVPKLPKQQAGRPGSRASGTTSAQASTATSTKSQSPDIDTLATAVKKITLNLSEEDKKAAAAARKPAKKATASKAKAPSSKPVAQPISDTGASGPVEVPLVPATSFANSPETSSAVPEVPPSLDGTNGLPTSEVPLEAPSHMPADGDTVDLKPAPSESGQSSSVPQDRSQSELDSPATSLEPAQLTPVKSGPTDTPDAAHVAETKPLPKAVSGPSVVGGLDNPPNPILPTDFVSYEPPGQPMRSATSVTGGGSDGPLTWMPTNTNTPVHLAGKKTVNKLPVFTSTGHIPFAAPRPVQSGTGQPSMIPVPKQQPSISNDAKENATEMGEAAAKEEQPASSVWDVPTTPQR